MTHALTPATERALAVARRHSPGPSLGLPETLLGLLSQSECLAAALLGQCQIDTAAVLARFPELSARPEAEAASQLPLSPPLQMAIAAVSGYCAGPSRELATEHLLLGMMLVENEVAHWLVERGVDAADLERRVHQRYHPAGVSESTEEPDPWPDVEPLDDQPRAGDRETGATAEHEAGRESPAQPASLSNPPQRAAPEHLTAWRAIDASANRAREGLRVVEDYARFALDDRHLTGELKQLRHDLSAVIDEFPDRWRFAARDTAGDVGTGISTPTEWLRSDLATIVAANFSRTAEALRSLEEFSKLVAPDAPQRLEQLRYRLYSLERAVGITRSSIQRLRHAQLYVLVDGGPSIADCEMLVRSLVAAGVDLLQLRDKALDDRRLLERARRLRAITAEGNTLLLINDRPDIAAAARADGVHLGQEDLSVRDARRIVGAEALIGVSTHSLQQARQAVLDGADYIGVGPTFPSETKSFAAFPGIELLSAVAGEIRLPAFAIGGINPENLPRVLATGVTRIAVSGAVTTAADSAAASRELFKLLRSIAIDSSG